MKKKLFLTALLIEAIALLSVNVKGNNYTCHYWIDSGQVQINKSGSFDIDVNGLSDGFHLLHAYAIGKEGMSSTSSRLFFKISPKVLDDFQRKVEIMVDGKISYEQILDDNDGLLNLNLDCKTLPPGLHFINAKIYGNECVSTMPDHIFYRVENTNENVITRSYYIIDGNYVGELDLLHNSSICQLNIDAESLSIGPHTLNVVTIDKNGVTSTETAFFYKDFYVWIRSVKLSILD